ncbi:AraC family transcriptional regulator [Mesorhizobium sp. ZC-5]|uniref:AraC family transcriptional regulator n=1 Tax=Mesorhizobium sp. ZC-5 TaxID=2986066 RepID=UPI0021E729AA|nr:AraC family transcriptional regulator [Mesorhizobium sp. ZC-5]MCV3241411.1 AraC family transcriptional regulator [Mesorhizobium sp. ZC-5]
MRPLLEKVTVAEGTSWTLLNRRLETEIPFQWHHHPEYELTLTLNSRGQRFIGDHIGSYDDGDLVLLGPNLPHTWCSAEKIDPERPHVALVMWFTPEWAEPLADLLTELAPVRAMLRGAGRGLAFSREAIREVRPAIEAMPDLPPDQRLLALMQVLTALTRDPAPQQLASLAVGRSPAAPADRQRIDRILAHIHTHYQDEISIPELAGIAFLSVSALHRLFRRHTNTTVMHYVARLRVGEACSLLIGTDRPIAHIAEAVGYSNLANFNRQFRVIKMMTPRAFRAKFKASNTA